MRAPLAFRLAVPADNAACVDLRGRTRENAVSPERLAAVGITTASWADDVRIGRLSGHVCSAGDAIVGYCFGDNASGSSPRLARRIALGENEPQPLPTRAHARTP